MSKNYLLRIAVIVVLALLTSATWAQSPQAAAAAQNQAAGAADANTASSSIESGTAIQASLNKAVDAKKAKPGDPIEARVDRDVRSAGKVVVPRGSKLIGHVTEAQAKSKDQAQSTLGIVFDRAVLKNGQSLEFHSVIRTLAAAPQTTPDDMAPNIANGAPTGGIEGPGPVGGVAGSAANTVSGLGRSTTSAAGNVASNAGTAVGNTGAAVGANAAGSLSATSGNIVGLPGLTISSAASSSTQGSLISSSRGNVHLDGGTVVVVQVTAQ